jgi:fimbrial chaperone protein
MRTYHQLLSQSKTSVIDILFGLIFTILLTSSKVHAGISVSPLSATLNLKDGRTHLLTVSNTNPSQPVAIRVKALAWQLDQQGKDIRRPTNDLVFFPMQFILPGGARRAIRIGPRDHIAPALELSYRVMVQEVPVDLQGKNQVHTGVKLITSYATAFYIAPNKPQSKLAITKTTVNQKQLNFTLINSGNAHTHLRKLSIMILQGDLEYLIDDPQALKSIYNENLLSKAQRHFTYFWPEALRKSIDMQAPMVLTLTVNCESCGGIPTVLNANIP